MIFRSATAVQEQSLNSHRPKLMLKNNKTNTRSKVYMSIRPS
jgi:hypothetical protein